MMVIGRNNYLIPDELNTYTAIFLMKKKDEKRMKIGLENERKFIT